MLCVNDFFARAVWGLAGWRGQSAVHGERVRESGVRREPAQPVARAAARLVPARRGSRRHCHWRRLHTTAHGTAGRAVERDPLERAARYDATQ